MGLFAVLSNMFTKIHIRLFNLGLTNYFSFFGSRNTKNMIFFSLSSPILPILCSSEAASSAFALASRFRRSWGVAVKKTSSLQEAKEHGEVEGGRSAAGLDDLRQQTCAWKYFSLDMTALAWLFTLLPVHWITCNQCCPGLHLESLWVSTTNCHFYSNQQKESCNCKTFNFSSTCSIK